MQKLAPATLALLCLALPAARGQDQPQGPQGPQGPLVEEVLVPEEAFEQVLKRHPGGVIVGQDELQALLEKAGLKPAPTAKPEAPPPVKAALERVRLSGTATDSVADLSAEAEVSVLGAGPVFLPLPLAGIGLRSATVDGQPARLLRSREGPVVMLEGAPEGATRKVVWRFAVKVEPGEERGSGAISFPAPAAASGRLELSLPGDVEVHAAENVVVWTEPAGAGTRAPTTLATGAFGGSTAAAPQLSVQWRPRRALQAVEPYAVADERSLFLVRQGVVTLESVVTVAIHRAERDGFQLDLPPGFVVSQLAPADQATGELSYAQQGDRVQVRFAAPREGVLQLRLRAELATGQAAGPEQLALRPLGFPDLQRASGLVGVARGEGSQVRFGEVSGLERADVGELRVSSAVGLLRVYRRDRARGETAAQKLELEVRPVEPRVDLQLKAAFQLDERALSVLAAFRFVVSEGRVFALRCELPAGFELETAVVRDGDGNEPLHAVKPERAGAPGEEQTSLTVELPSGLSAGQELLVTVQARREEPAGLAGRTLEVPRLVGSPAGQVLGYLGFSPDASFRLQGADLSQLTPIPAEELPRVGLQVPGLVLGYRIEAREYAGKLRLLRRETRLSSEALVMHRVAEQVVRTEARLELEVQEAPVQALELLVPEGVGRLMRVVGEGVEDDRELLGKAADGRERWRISFAKRKSGRVSLSVLFDTTLPGGPEGATGEGEVVVEALPRVSVAGAVRERGVVAVYSSDMNELEARPRGLRAIEVTEVPGAEAERTRPLFAFTSVGQDHGLGLLIRRRRSAEVLTAVAERLDLKSTVGADGLGRHEATFALKNLNNQFFALALPPDAVLWSVVVDGEGVKPAEGKRGLRLIPIPTAGTKGPNEVTEVKAVYTLPGSPMGERGRLDLGEAAARLLVHEDAEAAVPVLRSTWELALPDEVRVLEFEGNLTERAGGPQVKGTPSLALTLGRQVGRSGWFPWAAVLLLVGLLVAPSPRARGALVTGLAGLSEVGRGLGGGLGAAWRSKGVKIALVVALALVLLIGSCVTLVKGTIMEGRSFDRAAAGYAPTQAAPSGGGWGGAAKSEEAPGGDYEERGRYDDAPAAAAAPTPAPMEAPPMDAPAEAEGEPMPMPEGASRADAGPPPAPPPPPGAMPKPARPMAPRPRDEADARRQDLNEALKKTEAKELKDVQEKAKQDLAEGGEKLGRLSDEDDSLLEAPALQSQGGVGGGRGGQRQRRNVAPQEPGQQAPAQQPMSPPADPSGSLSFDGGGEEAPQADEPLVAEIPQSKLGEAGLRSLALELAPVGQRFAFERAGGSPALAVRYVQERLLTRGGGALVLAAFLACLLVPRLARVSYLGLLLLVGATATALPFVALPATVTPVMNALLAGALLAAPVHLALALHALWSTHPLTRLGKALDAARRQRAGLVPAVAARPAGAGRGGVAALLLALSLFGAGAARADEPPPPPPAKAGPAPRIYVPYDADSPDAAPGRAYVPREVYEWLWRRAYPGARVERPVPPPVPALVTRAEYLGQVGGERLALTVQVSVDVLAEGWQRCHLGLSGTGLEGAKVAGGKPEARVVVSPAGGYELVAQGPGTYEVELQVRAAETGGGWTFATVPALGARMRVVAPAGTRRVIVGGARAQTERALDKGQVEVEASLGETPRVSLSWAAREVLSAGGTSEASATTRTLCWVRRGRLVVLQSTTFAISGAGREGFVFSVPAGFQVTSVDAPSLRGWSVEAGKLTVALRRPSEASITLTLLGEQQLQAGAARFPLPQLEAQGVSREAGSLGLAVEAGLKVRPVESGLRQVGAAELSQVAGALSQRAGQPVTVERAFGFARRPSPLELELVTEPVELKADVQVQAVVLADRTRVLARIRYDVRKGAAYELLVAVPAEYELAGAPRELEVREVDAGTVEGSVRLLRFGLPSALSGQATLALALERRHTLGEAGASIPFPDVRAVGTQETGAVALAAGQGLELRSARDPLGLSTVEARSATRGWPAPEGGGEWRMVWRRGGTPGLPVPAPGQVQALRPRALVSGSWVLHVRVEHDVVRYVLRALYQIEHAGCRTFSALVPAEVADRVAVEAQNLREVSVTPAEGGMQRVQVELQSAAESFYDLALSWEEVQKEGQPFKVERVGVAGVDRVQRGFVLVEKAPDVPTQLVQGELLGEVGKGRAVEAPALPPGRAPTDFAFVWRVPTPREGTPAWSVAHRLEAAGTQKLPPPARVTMAELTTVVTSDGRARHRAVYRVRNLRLQFLALELPEVKTTPADVWSVFVDGEPRRLHREGKTLLIPLPKRTDADRSFDVEVIYATPLPAEFGFGARMGLAAPALRNPEQLQVERTFWTVYLPADWDYSGFEGLDRTRDEGSSVQQVAGQVEELKELENLARRGSGNARQVADDNVAVQLEVISGNLGRLDALAREGGKDEVVALAKKTREEYSQLKQAIESRRSEAQQQGLAQQGVAQGGPELQIEGQQFDQMASGWYSNRAMVNKNRVEWAGVAPGQAAQSDKATADEWTLAVPEGQVLDLKNAEVFQTKGGKRGQGQQQRMFQNRGYDQGQQEAEVEQQKQQAQQAAGKFRAQTANLDPDAPEPVQTLREHEQQDLDRGVVTTGESLPEGAPEGAGQEGLLSIRVAFPTPGRAFHFSSQAPTPELAFSIYPLHTAERGTRIARGVVLLVLLLGVIRLGLLAPLPGRRAHQALLLIAAGGLCAATFAHLAGAAVAFLVGVVMLRHGPLGGSAPGA